MEIFVWATLGFLFCSICSVPFTYHWVSKRNRYLSKLNSIGFQEDEEGLIKKFEGPAKPFEFFPPTDPAETTRGSKNPGFMYAAAGSTGLLSYAVIGTYYYVIYSGRIRRQKRIYNHTQIELLEQISKNEGDCSHLKDAFAREFVSS